MTAWQLASLQLLGLFAAARLIEVAASGIRLRLAWAERRARPEAERWYPLIVLTHVAVLLGSAATVLAREHVPPRPVLLLGLAALLVATALRVWLFVALRDRWNVRVIDPGEIVTTGPYRFVRHPNYLAVILEVAALPLVVGAYEVAVLGTLANAAVLSLRIPFEERALAARHPTYREVMMARPRFVPRPFGGAGRPATESIRPA